MSVIHLRGDKGATLCRRHPSLIGFNSKIVDNPHRVTCKACAKIIVRFMANPDRERNKEQA